MAQPDGAPGSSGPAVARPTLVEWQVKDGVGQIVLADPEHANVLGGALVAALVSAIHGVLDAAPRVVLLGARGPVFCAGGDIRAFVAAGDGIVAMVREQLALLLPAYLRLAQAPCPIVAAVQGPLGGAGIGLALAADLVLATPAVKMRTGYAAIGLSPDLGVSYFLSRRIGPALTQRLLLTSETVDAQRCLALGIVDEVHDATSFEQMVQARVRQWRDAAPESMAAIKRLCQGLPAATLADQLERERDMLERCAASADAREGISAFVQRRAATFVGR